ncbi:uncharacterized protein LOC118743622 isoform X2 [Rhagoletis pomonella]|uniref:uncharacterized protein LOC118743622 isoform X2 n=1 Tax=Rhagoletis pomonella TaxID=28610 RepID=UPI001780EE11|nr:uncharacterized protein LOC118743622 isoform X2 [Rhagoletis pomonella]
MSEKTYNFLKDSQLGRNHFLPLTMIQESQPVQKQTTQITPINTLLPLNTLTSLESSMKTGKPSNLESKMDTCLKEIICLKNENQEHNKTQTRLLTEILNIRRLLTEKTATSNRETAFPKTPFETKEEFLHFEDEIQRDAEKVKIIENEIFLIGIPECGKFVRAVWKRLVIDEVACQITWKNVDNKISLQNLAITAAFKEAYFRKFSNEADFKKFTTKWFQTARDRVNYKAKQIKL